MFYKFVLGPFLKNIVSDLLRNMIMGIPEGFGEFVSIVS